MKKYNLKTKNARKNLAAKREPYYDQIEPGLFVGFRRTCSGSESWLARCRPAKGKNSKNYLHISLGEVSDANGWKHAREAAEAWRQKIVKGVVDPGKISIADLCDEYVQDRLSIPIGLDREQAEKEFASATNMQQRFSTWILGNKKHRRHKIADIPLSQLTRLDILQWQRDLKERTTANSANRVLRILKGSLSYGLRQQYLAENFWYGIPELLGGKKQREYFLTKGQWSEMIGLASGPFKDYLKAAVFTGARPGELRRLSLADLDVVNKKIRLVNFKNRSRIRAERWFALHQPGAFEFFKCLADGTLPAAPLLCGIDGMGWKEQQLSNSMTRFRRAHELDERLVCYTIRHSVISHWLSLGWPVVDVSNLTGTSIEKIQGHYHHAIPDVMKERMSAAAMF